MMGGEGEQRELEGVIPRACSQVFDSVASLAELGWSFSLKGSFVEIYRDSLYDLLSGEKALQKLDVRYGIDVSSLTDVALSLSSFFYMIAVRTAEVRSYVPLS